jgi:c-di-GMP-binding flagellar brake protein YcgR
MSEKRRHPRYFVEFKNISGRILFSTNICILNISAGGVAISLDKKLSRGGTYILRLESRNNVLYMRGVVVWCRENAQQQENGDVKTTYTAGLKFVKVSVNQMKNLRHFVKENFIDYQKMETFTPLETGLRIHVRFLIHTPDRATISCTDDYRVKKISLGGMLIESTSALQDEETVPMSMTLSEEKAIAVWGRVVTCSAIQDADPPRYDIGIEFVDISDVDRETLEAFLVSIDAQL